ncbi:uncharacterized protein F5Z01DRAFT_268589 [Emericellopsis atlantica]|uniref:Uncharacterized protein n=1 Tax=Emericellopsis atlantica TaxID=2614577 RepID=A0A9P8CLL2_9HYPO|nr:uncharacterized protein F5Z01DRAFT_268589 [Emericellopsis atlantica]KAG9251518.1 hypothetical protein F5Z01DRAFT_268589 [Emericellopsis atlantica]
MVLFNKMALLRQFNSAFFETVPNILTTLHHEDAQQHQIQASNMPKASPSDSPDFKSLISENCHILYKRPASHFILATVHDPDAKTSTPWMSIITLKAYGGFKSPLLSGYGRTLIESLQDLHFTSSEALAKHINQKGWATVGEDDETSEDDDDEIDDLESVSSFSSVSTVHKDAKGTKGKREPSGTKHTCPLSVPRSSPGFPVFRMPEPAHGSSEKLNRRFPVVTGPPAPVWSPPHAPPPGGVPSNAPAPYPRAVGCPKPTKITVKDGTRLSYSFVEMVPHLWEQVTQAAMREFFLNKRGQSPGGAIAKVTWVVEGGIKTGLKCVLHDLSPVVRGGQGMVEFVVEVSDK